MIVEGLWTERDMKQREIEMRLILLVECIVFLGSRENQ